jgi:hypothetical protein
MSEKEQQTEREAPPLIMEKDGTLRPATLDDFPLDPKDPENVPWPL